MLSTAAFCTRVRELATFQIELIFAALSDVQGKLFSTFLKIENFLISKPNMPVLRALWEKIFSMQGIVIGSSSNHFCPFFPLFPLFQLSPSICYFMDKASPIFILILITIFQGFKIGI